MDGTIHVFNRVLCFTGISIFAKENWKTKKWFLIQFINVLVGIFIFIFSTGFLITNVSDLVLWIQGACVWSTAVLMNSFLLICFIFRSNFRTFLEEIIFKDIALEIPLIEYVMQMEGKRGKLNKLRDVVINTQNNLCKFTRALLIGYLIACIVCITLYVSGPVYSMYVREDESLRLLAFVMWFPWSLENFTVYELSYLFHTYAGYLCGILFPSFLSLLTLLIGQIIRQLRILKFILLNLDKIVEEIVNNRGIRWQEECTSVLIQCVQHFIKIKSFSKRLNTICQPFYLIMILDSTMLVCVCSVKINISDKFAPDIFKYYIQEFVFVLLNLMFCCLGQQVDNECEKLEVAVTEKWYIYDRKHKVNVLIFKIALSQRMPIYVFGSVTLSFVTFTWFVKTGMSFFTLMMSVLED